MGYAERKPVEIDEIFPAYTAEKRVENGSPVLYLNGKKTAPLIYALSDVPISSPLTAQAQTNIAHFAAQGIHLISTVVDLCKGWHKVKPYCADFLIGDLTAILETNPNAAILLRLYVNAPYWWMRDNPDELCIYGTGGVPYTDDGDYERLIDGDEENRMRVSIASEKWKNDAGQALKTLLASVMNTPQGKHVVGIQIAGGVYGEWHQWGFRYHPDYGKPMITYFRAFLREKYRTEDALKAAWHDESASFDTAVPAPPEMREAVGGPPYRSPSDSAYVIDSLNALQRCVPDAILHFARIVRQVWDRPILIGTFYGYYDPWPQVYIGGHLEPNRLLDGGLVDYMAGPFHYHPSLRNIAGTGCARGLLESARLHGVLWLTEMDNPPIGSAKCVGGLPERRKESVALMKRNILEPFTRGMGAWFFDHRLVLDLGYNTTIYVKKGWWDHPALLKEIRTLNRIADYTATTAYRPQAEVLCVFDTRSRYYSNASDVYAYDNAPLLYNALGRSGALYDCVNFDDLPLADLTRYKCMIFVHTPYLTKERRDFIRARLAVGGRHLIWINTSGYLNDTGCADTHISEISGISVRETAAPTAMTFTVAGQTFHVSAPQPYSLHFSPRDDDAALLGRFDGTDTPAAAKKTFADHTAWYFSVFPSDRNALREIFRESGVHICSEGGETLMIGGGIAVVSTDCDRDVCVTLPNGTTIKEHLSAMTTAVYDSATGRRLDTDA